jgi:hypothetical protein
MFGRMKDPVEGTATLVSYNETNVQNEFEMTLIAQVIVEGPGLPPTAVEIYPGVRPSQLPLPEGYIWKVKVDRAKPKRVKILEDSDAGEEQRQAGKQKAAELAEQMRQGGSAGA